MAVPKRKTSKSKKNLRRSHHQIEIPAVSLCPHCHNPRPPHRVCPHCGYYNGRKVMAGRED